LQGRRIRNSSVVYFIIHSENIICQKKFIHLSQLQQLI